MASHESDEIRYDITYETDVTDGDDRRRKAAVMQTRSLLSMWRGRFTTDTVSRTYPGQDAPVTVNSSSDEHIQVTLDRPDSPLTYTYDGQQDKLTVQETTQGVERAVGGDEIGQHYELAWILYQCDRAEAEGLAP